uniref:Uncharacterized protein n=1 Tax=Oryza sativa subsp. japonica TaxID=39947 RepID=Q6EQV3_ORYSJ|nr:hypothetical protein [Oryza sativa Japonica Group]
MRVLHPPGARVEEPRPPVVEDKEPRHPSVAAGNSRLLQRATTRSDRHGAATIGLTIVRLLAME